jgi:hypothetical protein
VGTLRSSKHVTAAAVVLAGFGAMAEAAVAAVEATQTGSQVTVTGDAAANTIGVARSGGTSTVTGVTSETAADCTLDVPTSTLSCTNAVNSIIVNAGDGADVLTGAVAALHGQGGNDVLNAGGSAPTSQGFSSDDDGGAGNDTFNGGPGSDFFVAEEGAEREELVGVGGRGAVGEHDEPDVRVGGVQVADVGGAGQRPEVDDRHVGRVLGQDGVQGVRGDLRAQELKVRVLGDERDEPEAHEVLEAREHDRDGARRHGPPIGTERREGEPRLTRRSPAPRDVPPGAGVHTAPQQHELARRTRGTP